jgi:hypothetical protein
MHMVSFLRKKNMSCHKTIFFKPLFVQFIRSVAEIRIQHEPNLDKKKVGVGQ